MSDDSKISLQASLRRVFAIISRMAESMSFSLVPTKNLDTVFFRTKGEKFTQKSHPGQEYLSKIMKYLFFRSTKRRFHSV